MSASALIKRIGNISNKAKMESLVQVKQTALDVCCILCRIASGYVTALKVTHARHDVCHVGAI